MTDPIEDPAKGSTEAEKPVTVQDPERQLAPVVVRGDEEAVATPKTGRALCLSGGGSRAMLFHAGALLRLNQAGLLKDLTCVSSVSGGSIAAGALAVAWKDLEWRDGRRRARSPRTWPPRS